MPAVIHETTHPGPLADRLVKTRASPNVLIHWLGQAGFVITANGWRVLIDPYLSDSLARKYRGTSSPHERMMPAPVTVDELGPLDLVLITHQHTDHMDPETLAPLAARQPTLRFVVPAASEHEARRRIGVGRERLVALDAGDAIEPLAGLRVTALRAAHETLERDEAGRHRFLGYVLRIEQPSGAVTIVHTGDTIPFEGQHSDLAPHAPDLLLLPVNGRSAELQARGIAGNLTLEEAGELTAAVGAPAMVAHHHGLFAFNTRPLAEIEAYAAAPDAPANIIPARPGLELSLELP